MDQPVKYRLGRGVDCPLGNGIFIIRIIREGVVVNSGKLAALKRFKDDAKEVAKGYDCGIQIKNFNNIEIGDIIEVEGYKGTVKDLDLRVTHLRNVEGKDIYIPNSSIIKNTLVNYTKDGNLRVSFMIGIAPECNISQTRRLITDYLKQNKQILKTPVPNIIVQELGEFTTDLQVLFWVDILENKKRLVKNSNYFSNYLSGSVSLQKNDSRKAYNFFENIENLGIYHSEFNLKYVETLVNNGKIEEAYIFIKKLDKSYQSLYPFNLILFVHDFKKERYSKLQSYISSPKQSYSDPLLLELYQNLGLWADLSNKNIEDLNEKINRSNSSFKNVSLTQKILINLYLDNQKNIDLNFSEIFNKKELSRYNYFYLSYYLEKNNKDKINDIINRNLEISSENLLFKQLFLDSRENKFYKIDNFYKRKNINHGLAELLYLFANFYQNYEQVQISNFYLNLSEYLNPNFLSNKILKVENLITLNNLEESEKEIKIIEKLGKEFNWYANLTRLRFLPNNNTDKQINLLKNF